MDYGLKKWFRTDLEVDLSPPYVDEHGQGNCSLLTLTDTNKEITHKLHPTYKLIVKVHSKQPRAMMLETKPADESREQLQLKNSSKPDS